jgi:hypothetical protein
MPNTTAVDVCGSVTPSLFVGCEQNGSGWRRSFDGTVKSNSKWYTPLRTPTGAKLASRRNVLLMPYNAALVADLRPMRGINSCFTSSRKASMKLQVGWKSATFACCASLISAQSDCGVRSSSPSQQRRLANGLACIRAASRLLRRCRGESVT